MPPDIFSQVNSVATFPDPEGEVATRAALTQDTFPGTSFAVMNALSTAIKTWNPANEGKLRALRHIRVQSGAAKHSARPAKKAKGEDAQGLPRDAIHAKRANAMLPRNR